MIHYSPDVSAVTAEESVVAGSFNGPGSIVVGRVAVGKTVGHNEIDCIGGSEASPGSGTVPALKAANDQLMSRDFYRAWAEAAEKAGDLKTAAAAYQTLSDLIPDVSDLSKLHKRYKYKAEKLRKMVK